MVPSQVIFHTQMGLSVNSSAFRKICTSTVLGWHFHFLTLDCLLDKILRSFNNEGKMKEWGTIMKKRVLSILVDNMSGVLGRISGLFSRRGYNIDSLTVGETHNSSFSRMTVVVRGDDQVLDQIEKQVAKLEDVRSVKVLQHGPGKAGHCGYRRHFPGEDRGRGGGYPDD